MMTMAVVEIIFHVNADNISGDNSDAIMLMIMMMGIIVMMVITMMSMMIDDITKK